MYQYGIDWSIVQSVTISLALRVLNLVLIEFQCITPIVLNGIYSFSFDADMETANEVRL